MKKKYCFDSSYGMNVNCILEYESAYCQDVSVQSGKGKCICAYCAWRPNSHFNLFFCLPVTAVPSAPRSVISSVNETSLLLEWSDPRDLGGREDIFYNVICKKCLPERGMCSRCDDNVDISPRHLGLTQRRVAVRNLQAHTQYSFEIQAVNGVSNKSPNTPQYSTVNITTNQAGRYNCSFVASKDQY